jgi:thiol-disulfide isomerase/thioredoxin
MKTFLTYAVVAVAAAVTGFLIYRFVATPPTDGSSEGSAIAASSGVPEELPEFTLADRAGEPRSIRSWPGKSLIVNFWATWCAPCRREIPLLKQIQAEHDEAGFQVVGVAVDFREDVLAYADEIGIDYPLLIGEEDGLDAVNAFGISAVGFPFTAFTDQRGRIVALHLGELLAPQADVILDAVQRVNRGELTIAEARTGVATSLAALESESG